MNNLTVIDTTNDNTMTSMQVSDITGKEHFIILRDIRDEIEKLENGGVSTQYKFVLSERRDSTGRTIPYYKLTKEGVLQLAARYDAVTRAKLIEMAMQNEAQKRLPSNYKEALLALVASEEEKERLTLERDFAIQTKHWISDKKTATAMSTAAKLAKEIKRLTDNEKKHNEYTATEIAEMFNIRSLSGRPHAQLITAYLKTLDDKEKYHRIVKCHDAVENKFYDQIYFNQKFITIVSGYLETLNESLGYVEINNRRYKFLPRDYRMIQL